MAGIGAIISGLPKFLRRGTGISAISVRNESTEPKMNWNKWLDWKMVRDVKRRKCVQEHAPMRLRIVSMKRNSILPPEIQEIASEAIREFPPQSAKMQLTNRCVLTSRPRGVVYRWKLSRIVFRDLVDNNKLGGVQRAMW